jgi:hypothetical protein
VRPLSGRRRAGDPRRQRIPRCGVRENSVQGQEQGAIPQKANRAHAKLRAPGDGQRPTQSVEDPDPAKLLPLAGWPDVKSQLVLQAHELKTRLKPTTERARSSFTDHRGASARRPLPWSGSAIRSDPLAPGMMPGMKKSACSRLCSLLLKLGGGFGGWGVAVEDVPAVGAPGFRGAVGVEDELPASAVDTHVMVVLADQDAVLH